MAKDKIKLVFEIDRFKVIGCLARHCETKEEYEEMMKIINSTDEIVRDDAELEVIYCNMILDKILSDTRTWLFANVW